MNFWMLIGCFSKHLYWPHSSVDLLFEAYPVMEGFIRAREEAERGLAELGILTDVVRKVQMNDW